MIKYLLKGGREKKLKILADFQKGSWVYVENPSEKELKTLAEKLKLDLSLLKDALDPNEVPRLETDKETVYIFTRVPIEQEEITTLPFLIAIGQNFFLTLSSGKIPVLENFFGVESEFITGQKVKFLIQIFFALNSRYDYLLTSISRRVTSTRVRLEKIENKDIIQLVGFEEILSDFLAALIPTSNVLQKLLSGGFLTLYEKDRNLIEDLSLGNSQLIETSKSTLKRIVNIRDAYSTIMSHDLNRVIKLLAALTIILTIPTAVFSLYGMNVSLPWQDSSVIFAALLVTTLAIISLILYIFIKNKWL